MKAQIIHLFDQNAEGEMAECGRGYYADKSFEKATLDIKKVTCKQCLKAFNKKNKKS